MKTKDLRGYLFSIALIILDVALILQGIQSDQNFKIIIGVLVIPIILVGLLTQFRIRILNDSMLLFHFIGILSMPVLLDYSDIITIHKAGKYKIKIEAKARTYSIYVADATKVYDELMTRIEGYRHEKN